ncbi:hypothetical protein PAMP_023738 [Pampus punctatissimus]
MWCYQKPGYGALLLSELQRQQQCSQFCDTLLKAQDVSVPAHSCILSAISPHFSAALSSTSALPAGQSRLLEFQTLGACTLLHMVRLLYSGEMAGEGEKEKQEAISAAAKLGIHGLVEVTERDRKNRKWDGDSQQTEVGVQTEPVMLEESEARDGSTLLWKEMLSNSEKDSWMQTEELQVNTAPFYHPAASFETINVTDLQSLGQIDSHLVHPQIPCIPISCVYPPDANQTHHPLSAPAASFQKFPATGHTPVAVVEPPYSSLPPSLLPFSSQATPWAADPHSCWAGPQGAGRDVAEGEEWEDEHLKHFQNNIPGFISYFLNPDEVEGPRREQPQRRGAGGARRAETGERRARRPRVRTRGRGRRGLTQTVDVQDVGVSSMQKLFLQRWGRPACTRGQGGGAVGRKLFLKTRELLKRRRGRGKAWDFIQSGQLLPYIEIGGEGNTQRRRKTPKQEFNQHKLKRFSPRLQDPVGRPQRARAKSATSVSFSSHPMRSCNIASPSLQASSASSILHTTSLPAPPPCEDQPEHFDHLLEEVIMGFDCFSSVNTSSQNKQQSHVLLDAVAGFNGSADVVAIARGAGRSSSANGEVPVLQQNGEGELTEMLDYFLQTVEQHIDSCTTREGEEKAGEGTTEASKPYTVSRPKVEITAPDTPPQHTHTAHPAPTHRPFRHPDETPQIQSQPLNPPKHTEGTSGRVRAKRPRRRKVKQYLFSLEKQSVKKRVSDTKTKILHDRDKQLQQMPVVQVERRGPLPARVILQRCSCQSLEVKSPAETKTSLSSSSSVKSLCVNLSKKNQLVSWNKNTYPIRSRFKEAQIMVSNDYEIGCREGMYRMNENNPNKFHAVVHIMNLEKREMIRICIWREKDSMPFLEQPLPDKRRHPAGQPGQWQNNKQVTSSSNDENPTTPIQLPPVEPRDRDEQLESNHKRCEEDLTVLPQEEAKESERMGTKRGAEEETGEDTNVTKRVRFKQRTPPTSETCLPRSESIHPASETAAMETKDVIDVETVLLSSVGDTFQRKEEKTEWTEFKLVEADQNREERESLLDKEMESDGDDIIDVDGDSDGSTGLERADECREQAEKIHLQNRTAPALSQFVKVKPPASPHSRLLKEVSLGSTGSREEDRDGDIDVIGGSSPLPDPVIISWTVYSGSEEEEGDEEIDVTGEETAYSSSAVFTLSKGELNRKYHPKVLLP